MSDVNKACLDGADTTTLASAIASSDSRKFIFRYGKVPDRKRSINEDFELSAKTRSVLADQFGRSNISSDVAWCLSLYAAKTSAFNGFLAYRSGHSGMEGVSLHEFRSGEWYSSKEDDETKYNLERSIANTPEGKQQEAYTILWAFLQDIQGLADDVKPDDVLCCPRSSNRQRRSTRNASTRGEDAKTSGLKGMFGLGALFSKR